MNIINTSKYSLSFKKKMRLGRVTFLGLSANALYFTSKLTNYYFGVREDEATAARPAYATSGSLRFGPGFDLLYLFNRKWSFFALVNFDIFDKNLHNSPIVTRKNRFFSLVSVNYNF